jgi:tetratricopeptide (TPR) repeat protein/transglutaminase-like putative cysteine protease
MMRNLRVLGSSAFFCVLSLSAVSKMAAQGAPVQPVPFAGAPFTSSIAELKSASAAMPATKEFGAEILYEEGIYRIAADGTLKYQHRLIYRVDTESTVKSWAEVSSEWDPWFENPSQLHARVLQPDGNFVELDQKTITDAPVKAEDNETFSSRHVRRAPLPGMAIGAIIEETQNLEGKTPYFSGGALYRFFFRQYVPVGRARLVVELPSTMPYKELIHQLPGLSITRTEVDGTRRVVFEATGITASHDYDIDLATNTLATPMVEFSTGQSWGAIASGYAALANPQTVTAEAQAILPKDLPAARMAKIQAIVKQLHHEVRYTGVEFGAAQLTPQRPSQVIQRHYGDCKDKATLLVAMLRAVGIKANLALLSTGPGMDVDPALPGINRFDHAIVYVPAGGPGEDAMWIDATAEYFAVGTLPYGDKGRNALVISPETTKLTKTPEPQPEDSVLVETRTYTLAELGPSHVDEVSETHGNIDAAYRNDYGGPETPKIHEEMETYVKNAYLAKTLARLEHGDSADFEHPFKLTLAADGAKRGMTSLIDGLVVIFPSATANSMPKWFSTKPQVPGPDMSADAKHELDLAEKSRPASFVFRPYISEQRTRILIPTGFTLRSLPANKTTQLGTASLTESYSAAEPGVVTATFRFNSGPYKLTAEQALAMRTALLELHERDYVGIYFDQAGVKALTAGHIREGLEIDRSLIAGAPSGALHHLHLARALLDAGIGSEAQAEAKRATELDPKLSAAFATLGWALEHNALGERFGKGFDLPGALAAYKRAVELDPQDNDQRFDLAILNEFDARGTRYAPDSDMTAAIKGYKDLIELNKDKGEDTLAQYRENLLYALLYSRQFAELDKMLASLPSTNSHRALAITSAAAQRGTAAGVAEADRGNHASTDRNKNLRSAGTQLANLHLYGVAAEVMSAGMEGGDDAATAARQIELYKALKTASLAPLPATNPAAPVQMGVVGLLSGTLTREQALNMTSKHAYSSPESMERDISKGLAGIGFMRRLAEKMDMTESVMLDLIAGNTTYSAKGDDEHGWAVMAQMSGAEPDRTYVVKEDGAYRIVSGEKDTTDDNASVGNEVLWALDHGKRDEAKALLDWKRDLTHKQGTDDPFSGPMLPRFWTIGSSKPGADSPEAMKLAGISLLAGSMDAKPYLAEIAADREKASGQRQTDLDLLLAVSAMNAEQPALGMPAAQRLMEQEPDSVIALNLAGFGYSLRNDPAGWQALLAPRLAKKPGDHDLLAAETRAYELAHNFNAAQETQRKVLDSGKATADDYNNYAWIGLFHNDLGDDITKAAQQSAEMGKNSGFSELHTLACIYAAQGKTTEARQVLQQAMDAGNMAEPNSVVWYALGLIYEQYGAKAAALDAYRRVQAHEFDDHTYVDPASTYVLAQDRIRELSK